MKKIEIMRNLKLILPMLAFVLAIGMSFAFTSSTEEDYYATKYILTDNGWEDIQVTCPTGSSQCTVSFEDDPQKEPYLVYDQPNDNFPTDGTGIIVELPGDVPGS